MIRPVHVVASFNTRGKATPLYFRLSLDEGAPTYKVKILYIEEDLTGSYMATYYCRTTEKGKEIELQLIFVAHFHSWSLSLSNSRAQILK